jgi:hypothetical protein
MTITDEQLIELLLGLTHSRRKLVNALANRLETSDAHPFRRSMINPMPRRYASGPTGKN